MGEKVPGILCIQKSNYSTQFTISGILEFLSNVLNTVKPVLNGISRVQNIFLLKPGFCLIKVYYDSHRT
jgi:hypothetical protein